MVSEAIALLGLMLTIGLGITFAAATILVAGNRDGDATALGIFVTGSFFTAAFFLAKYLGI